jgi:protein-tyrosine phosphatase
VTEAIDRFVALGELCHAQPVDQCGVVALSHIEGNLFQGGCNPGVRLPDDFRAVVSLWEGRYAVGPQTVCHEFTMYDSPVVDADVVESAATLLVDLCQSGPTVVHCQAGLNRSGLVAARALMLLGRTADEAIGLLRERRSEFVLCNGYFERWLRETL